MNKLFYSITLILVLSLSLFGQPGPKGPGHHGPRHRGRPESDKRLGHDPLQFFRRIGINLTEAQADKMYDIAIKFVKEEESIRLEIEKIDYNIREELIKDNPDRNMLKNLIKSKKDYEAERDYLKMVRDLDIINVLTPQQRSQLHNCKMR